MGKGNKISYSFFTLICMNMKKLQSCYLVFLLFILPYCVFSQSKTNDIPVNKLPDEVKKVLEEYIQVLKTSESLDDCAENMIKVAGGGLVNEDGASLRNTIKPYSLKKDFNNIKFYADPIKITRVNRNPNKMTDGYGESAIRGITYKIWISKKEGQPGMPAPISILVPEGHETIKSPKVVGIGSL